LAAVGLLVYCLAAAGPRSLGKASLLLLPLSYGLLITLCIRTCLDPAGPAAVITLLSPHWASLHQATAWLEAAAHAIWSLQLGTGVISTLGAYNKFQKQLLRDATVVTAGHAVWVLLSTFLLLSLTGLADTAAMESVAAKQEQEAAMAVLSQRSVVGDDGLLLANLQLILAAFSELSQGWLWAALYCILLLLILLTNLAGYLELITNSVIGHRVSCIRFKPLVALLVMLVLVLLCLPLTTQSGLVVQQVLATFCADWPTLLFSILTVVAATCCHSMLSLVKDLCYMSRHQLSHFLSSHLSVVLTTIAPVLLATSLGWTLYCLAVKSEAAVGLSLPTDWGLPLVWCISLLTVLPVLLGALWAVLGGGKEDAQLWSKHLRGIFKPTATWHRNQHLQLFGDRKNVNDFDRS